jgi:hypothetical protein
VGGGRGPDRLRRAAWAAAGPVDHRAGGRDQRQEAVRPERRRPEDPGQGHSVEVDLALEPRTPPEVLFHGTATRFLDSIRAQGLLAGSRNHVHLSADEATAVKVGSRHGRVVVLKVRAGEMDRAGVAFYRSDNGVWLTAHVGVGFLEFP